MSTVEPFAGRLRREEEELRGLELLPGACDGPKNVPAGCYRDGSPGPQLWQRMERAGYAWIGHLRGERRAL